jgi:hypothetical protein
VPLTEIEDALVWTVTVTLGGGGGGGGFCTFAVLPPHPASTASIAAAKRKRTHGLVVTADLLELNCIVFAFIFMPIALCSDFTASSFTKPNARARGCYCPVPRRYTYWGLPVVITPPLVSCV